MDEFLRTALFVAVVEGLGALVVVFAVRARQRKKTGAARYSSCAPRHYRNVASVLVAAALVALLLRGGELALPGGTALLAALACLWLRPHAGDEVFGAEGVQRGWQARSFDELEEWRLTGDHLRFRIGPTWLAVGLPAREHAGVRELLLERRPEAESRFSR